jgi:hypothetical protein
MKHLLCCPAAAKSGGCAFSVAIQEIYFDEVIQM